MIEVNNLTTNKIDENFIKEATQKVLREEKRKEDVSIAFIGSGRMRKLNKKYRKKNRVTDVLAFGQAQSSKLKAQKLPVLPESELSLGEIVICLREVKKSAKKYKVSFEEELGRVLIHGILHLLGYNHEKLREEGKKMREKEEYYLQKI